MKKTKRSVKPIKEKTLPTRPAVGPLGAAIAAMLLAPNVGFSQTTPAETPATKTLGTVEVKSSREAESTGYNPGITKVGKVTQAIKDIPQAITVVPKELMIDKNDTTFKEALRNVAGLTFNAGEGGRIGDNMNLRGFYSFGDLYMDGVRDTAQYNRETFNLEQIDVLRGSGSMLFGRGQAGGVINQVSKTPLMTSKGNLSVTGGNYDYYRGTVDANQVLSEEQGAAIRLNAMKHDSKSSRDVVRSEREGFAPSIAWGLGTDNQITLSHYYLKTHNVPDYGIGFNSTTKLPADLPISAFGGTKQDYEDNTTHITTLAHEYTFDKDTKLSTKARKSNYSRDLWSNKGRATAPVTTLSLAGPRGAEETTYSLQSDFSTQFATGPLKHEILVGGEFLRENLNRWSYRTDGCASSVISNYDLVKDTCIYGYGNRVQTPGSQFGYDGNSYSVYAQDMIEFFPGWKLLGGVRQDWLKAEYFTTGTSLGASKNASLSFSEQSYRTGLTYQPNTWSTYYLSYNNSFNATADLYQLSAGTGYPAERSNTTELGAKWDLFDGDLAVRTAIYRTEKHWERNTDLESTGTVLSQKRHTDGIELEIAGRLGNQFEIFAGGALMKAKIDERGWSGTTRHNAAIDGMTPRNTPSYTYNLWTIYKPMAGLKFGLGVIGVGQRLAYGLSANVPTVNKVPAYTRFDAMAQYDYKDFTLKLNVQNLANATIYESVYENGGFTVPGTKRAVQLTGIVRF